MRRHNEATVIFRKHTHSSTPEVGREISATPRSSSHPMAATRERGLVSTVALLRDVWCKCKYFRVISTFIFHLSSFLDHKAAGDPILIEALMAKN